MRSLSLEVLADFACWYSSLGISNLCFLTQVMNGLPAFASVLTQLTQGACIFRYSLGSVLPSSHRKQRIKYSLPKLSWCTLEIQNVFSENIQGCSRVRSSCAGKWKNCSFKKWSTEAILYGPFAPDNLCATIPFHGICLQWDGDSLSRFSVGSWPSSGTAVSLLP